MAQYNKTSCSLGVIVWNCLYIDVIADWFILPLVIKDRNHLYKDGEEDDRYDGSQKHVLHLALRQQEPKWEGYSTTQATVGNNELVLFGQLHNPELINNKCKTNDSWNNTKFEKKRSTLWDNTEYYSWFDPYLILNYNLDHYAHVKNRLMNLFLQVY